MKTTSFIISLTFFMSTALWAQDIMVKDFSQEMTVGYQKTNSQTFRIQNFSSSEKSISITQSLYEMQGGSIFKICYEGNCATKNQSLHITIPANSTSSTVEMSLKGGISNFNTMVYLEFFDLQVEKTLKKEVELKVTDKGLKDIFFEKGDIKVNSFFPNPAVKKAIMEYSISPHEEEAKITLQNVLGSIVSTYSLSPEENRLSINTESLHPGVYFYTLSIKDEGLATRKLIVKR